MKRVIVLVLILAAALIAAGLLMRHRDPAKAYTADQEAWRAFKEGDRLLQAFRFTDAVRELQRALAHDPWLAPAHAGLVEAYMMLGHQDSVKRHLALADSLAATLADRRGRVLLQLRLASLIDSRHHARRDSLFDLAREMAPKEIEVLAIEARSALQDQDLERSERLWREVLAVNPNHAHAYNYLGYIHLNQGRYDEAEQAMRHYAFVAPDLANPHDSLGEVLMASGRYEEAEYEFLRAIDKQKDFYFSQINLVQLYLARGQVQRAVELAEVLLDVLSGTALEQSFERTLISRLFVHRLTDLVEVYGERYLQDETESRSRIFVQIQMALGRNDPQTALASLDSLQADQEATPWYPEVPGADRQIRYNLLRLRAFAVAQLDRHAEAVALLRQALAAGGDLPPHRVLMEQVQIAYNLVPLGRLDEARTRIGKALAVNPRLAEGLLVAAYVEAAAGRDAEALQVLDALDQALELADPGFPALVDARRLREQLGDPGHI